MAPRGAKVRHVRIDDDLWKLAAEKAASEGTNLSEIIRAALTRYVGKKK